MSYDKIIEYGRKWAELERSAWIGELVENWDENWEEMYVMNDLKDSRENWEEEYELWIIWYRLWKICRISKQGA